MMKLLRITIAALLAVAILAGAFWALTATISWLSKIDSALAGTIITAIAGILGLLYTQWHAKTREIAEGHRANKIAVYNTFFDIVEEFVATTSDEDAADFDVDSISPKFKKQFAELTRGMIIWASPSVIRAWLKFRQLPTTEGANVLLAVDDMFTAIRKDLGNSNFGLKRGDVIKNFLSDPGELDRSLRTK